MNFTKRRAGPLTAAPLSLILAAMLLTGAAPPATGEVTITVSGLRSAKGLIQICMTREKSAFPDCRKDPDSRRMTVPASDIGKAGAEPIRFTGLPTGRYAVALLHDENSNGRADMALMVPREGYGFSRDAAVRFGPPNFDKAAFAVGATELTMPIRMRYLL